MHTDLKPGSCNTRSLANYENPKLIAVWGTTATTTVTFIVCTELRTKSPLLLWCLRSLGDLGQDNQYAYNVGGAGDKITVTFILFANLKRAGDKITVTFIMFVEPGTK